MDLFTGLIDLITKHRNKILEILFFPGIIIYFASVYNRPELIKIQKRLFEPTWLQDGLIITESAILLFAWVGIIMLCISLSLSIVVKLFEWRFKLTTEIAERIMNKSTGYSILFLIETSMWWYLLFSIKILYQYSKPTDLVFLYDQPVLNIEFGVQLIGVFYLFIMIARWFWGKKD